MKNQKEWTWRSAGPYEPLLRAASALGALAGLDRRPFDAERLLAAAVDKSGLDDFGDPRFREGLDVLCDAYTNEADFNILGRLWAQHYLIKVIADRLRIVDWRKRHPQVREEKIEKPWIVLGLPRSGTTLTSTLIDLDAHVRSPLVWEVDTPMPPPTLESRYTDPRIASAGRILARACRLTPALPAIHYMEPLMPHECIMLTLFDFRSLFFQGLAVSPAYGEWYVNCDMSSGFAMHKSILQIWQNEIPIRRWGLKAPNHLHAIDDLMAAYPDARVVWVHRDPAVCIPSISSLMAATNRPLTKSPNPVAVGRHLNWMYRTGIERTMRYDERASNRNWCHHLHYSALMRDPVAAMRAAYAHFDEEIEPEHERRIAAWLRLRPKNVFGRHKYSLAEFGLAEASLRAQYADYTERYSVESERAPGS